MIIGNKPKLGTEIQINKWYWCIELLKCPPTMINIFKPYLFIMLVRFKDLGQPCQMGGSPEKKIGGWKQWSFPIGLEIRIIK